MLFDFYWVLFFFSNDQTKRYDIFNVIFFTDSAILGRLIFFSSKNMDFVRQIWKFISSTNVSNNCSREPLSLVSFLFYLHLFFSLNTNEYNC